MSATTRGEVERSGVSVWLNADLDVVMERVRRKANRPLLKTADPRKTLQTLMEKRQPVYALADLTVHSREVPHDRIVDEILQALKSRLLSEPKRADKSQTPAPGAS